MPKYPSTGPRPDPTQTSFGRSPIDRGQGDPGGGDVQRLREARTAGQYDALGGAYLDPREMKGPGEPGGFGDGRRGGAAGQYGDLGGAIRPGGGLQSLIGRGIIPGLGGAASGGAYPASWVSTYNAQSPGTQAAISARYGGMNPGQIMSDWNANVAPMYAPGTDPGAILGGAPQLSAGRGLGGGGIGRQGNAKAAAAHRAGLRGLGAPAAASQPSVFGDPAPSGGAGNLMGLDPGSSGGGAYGAQPGTAVAGGGLPGLIGQRRQTASGRAPDELG